MEKESNKWFTPKIKKVVGLVTFCFVFLSIGLLIGVTSVTGFSPKKDNRLKKGFEASDIVMVIDTFCCSPWDAHQNELKLGRWYYINYDDVFSPAKFGGNFTLGDFQERFVRMDTIKVYFDVITILQPYFKSFRDQVGIDDWGEVCSKY